MIVLLQWIQIQNFDSYYNSFTAFYQGIRGIVKLLQIHHYFCKNTTMRKNYFNSVRGGRSPPWPPYGSATALTTPHNTSHSPVEALKAPSWVRSSSFYTPHR